MKPVLSGVVRAWSLGGQAVGVGEGVREGGDPPHSSPMAHSC